MLQEDTMSEPETKPEADVIPLPVPASTEEHTIPSGIAAELRKLRGKEVELTNQLGQLTVDYVVKESRLVSEILKMQQGFGANAKNALMAIGVDAQTNGSWDFDIAAGVVRKAG